MGSVAGAAALGGLETHQFSAISGSPVAPHQYGTTPSRRCNHVTWSVVELWTAFPWV